MVTIKKTILLIILFLLPVYFHTGVFGEEISLPPEDRPSQVDSVEEETADLDEDIGEDLDEEEEEILVVSDPYEPINRVTFWFNDKFYFFMLKPVARVYRIVPEPARVSVGNFLTNLATPARLINSLLQLKFTDVGNELARFIINSTLGIGGLFDPARKWAGIRKKDEDFGQTLGRYGVGSGSYVIVPLLGPSNTRDGIGNIVDIFLDPITYGVGNFGEYAIVKTFDGVNQASLDKDTYESIKEHNLDPYLFIRNAYEQKRRGAIEK